MEEIRQNLIRAIIDLGGDEFETKDSYLNLALSTDEELVHILIGIAEYYRDESQQ